MKQKKEVKVNLYSLVSWNFKKKALDMPDALPLQKEINKINKSFIEAISSTAFFKWCLEIVPGNSLYEWVNTELPKKQWLFELSSHSSRTKMTVSKLFSNKPSLLNCLKKSRDVNAAYAPMQYVEGYYLISEAIRKKIKEGKETIQIAFILPNDEIEKFFRDYPQDLETWLRADFKDTLNSLDISIIFKSFNYEKGGSARPYIDKSKGAQYVEPNDIKAYFDYLPFS